MSLPDFDTQYAAIRTRTAIARTGQTRLLRLSGEGARAAALWLLPSRLHLRDAQARQSLLLDSGGRPIADVVVAADDEDYLLLIEGPGDPVAHVKANLRGDVTLTELDATHEVIDVHGPWAWELVSQVLGEDLLALPYLNFFRMDEGLCVRAGRTGEYGYHLLAKRTEAAAIHARFVEKGAELELAEVGVDALALAGFENWFFDAHHVPEGATPVELSLSWRLAGDRDFLGRAAVDARRTEPGARQACLLADTEVRVGDRVLSGDRDVGAITRSAYSPTRERWIASALVDPRLVPARIALRTSGGVAITTTAPPLVDNQSLYVDPRRHTYRARDEVRFGVPRESAEAGVKRLDGRVIVVTGGSRGLGRAIALDAASEGARVVVGYRRRDREALEVAAQAGNDAVALPVDVREPASVDAFFAKVVEICGAVDGLVTSAGIVSDGWLATMPVDQFDDVVTTNLRGTMLATRAVLRPMMARKKGSIVALTSVAGLRASPGQAAYSASKGAIHAMMRTLAVEVAKYGIRVNTLAPGLIDAGMVKATSPERLKSTLVHVPLGRLGEAREVARSATFLLSDDASFITGHTLVVDGGLGA